MAMTIHNQDKWLWTSPFYQTAITLWGKGYPADYVSKRLLGKARWVEGRCAWQWPLSGGYCAAVSCYVAGDA